MTAPSILIVEDDKLLRASLAVEFQDKGYLTFEAYSLDTIPSDHIDYAIVDMRLKGVSGLEVVRHLRETSPNCRIVILTGYGSISTAVEAIKLGAVNYLTKPADIDKIENALKGITSENSEKEGPATLSQQEHEYIEYMLLENGGNISKTAQALGLHRQSLQRKLRKRPS